MPMVLIKCFAILFALAACTPDTASTPELTSITVQLGTNHQALYTGVYAAVQNGYFAREGLSVSLIEGGTAIDITTPVVNGRAQFGIMGASSVIVERAARQPVRAIAAIVRRDPVVFFSLAESGILRLEDFAGRRVQVSARLHPRLQAMLNYARIPSDNITIANGAAFTDLYSGGIDVASGTLPSAVLSARRAGHEVNLIYPDDYGVHFYSSVIFTTDQLIDSNSDLVERFLRAILEGYAYAIENPQTAGELVKQYNPQADAEFETASMIAYLPYINTGEDYIGWMKPEIWEGMAATMHEHGELTTPLDVSDAYTTQFLEHIYLEKRS